jgi:hypothetical protein
MLQKAVPKAQSEEHLSVTVEDTSIYKLEMCYMVCQCTFVQQ